MAIYSAVPPPEQQQQQQQYHTSHHQQLSSASTASVDIEAWTVSALQSLCISPAAVGTGNPLTIPLDDHAPHAATTQLKLRNVTIVDPATGASITPPRRPPSRRDSMRKREALLKGKEGSRQRRRWENDRLLHIPNVEPPTPADWDVHPTHPVHHIPYRLAQFWDQKGAVRERVEQRQAAQHPSSATAVGRVPRDLHTKAKRTPAVKTWLRVLEEPVRRFLVERGVAASPAEGKDDYSSSSSIEVDSDDEEIVFVGRNERMRDAGWKKARRETRGRTEAEAPQGMVLDGLGDDESASFKRWLTHSISAYYGLDSRSVLVGQPAKKVVYIEIRQMQIPGRELPRPLWEMF